MKTILKISFLLSLFSLFMLGCATNSTKNYDGVATDNDIKAMFENYEFVSKYNYFYTYGIWDITPAAIIGINQDYVLVKDSNRYGYTNWQQFEPGSEKLKELVEAMVDAPPWISASGYKIYDQGGGGQIGIMYSMIGATPARPEVRFKNGKRIIVKPLSFGSGSGAP